MYFCASKAVPQLRRLERIIRSYGNDFLIDKMRKSSTQDDTIAMVAGVFICHGNIMSPACVTVRVAAHAHYSVME